MSQQDFTRALLPFCFPIFKTLPHKGSDDHNVDENLTCQTTSDQEKLNLYSLSIDTNENLTVDASREMGHCIMMQFWYLVLRSCPVLFQPKNGLENYAKLLREYVVERQHTYSNKVFVDELFYDDSVRTGKLKGGESSKKKRKKENQQQTIMEYMSNLIKSCLNGELASGAIELCEKGLSKKDGGCLFSVSPEYLKELVLQLFTFNPENMEQCSLDDVFLCFVAILEYLILEVLDSSFSLECHAELQFISSPVIQNASHMDEDLSVTLFNYIGLIPRVNLKFFYGANEDGENVDWTGLSKDISFEILSKFDNFKSLMEMRLVCKSWNHIILTDMFIWKSLARNVMVREDLFSACDSTFSIEEMETILSSPVNDDTPKSALTNYFIEMDDWLSIYLTCVHNHLQFLKDTEKLIELGYEWLPNPSDQAFSYSELQDIFKESITKMYVGARTNPVYEHLDFITIPKSHIEDFMKIGNNYTFIGSVNFSQLSSLISCRKFPKTGLLYFFFDMTTEKGITLYYENGTEKLKTFKVTDTTFQIAKFSIPVCSYIDSVMVNSIPSHPLLWTQKAAFPNRSLVYSSYDFGRSMYSKTKPLPTVDRVVLLSDNFALENDDEEESLWAFSVYISPQDLKSRNFSKTTIQVFPHYAQFMD